MTHLITSNKFDPSTDIPTLDGKVFIVTGGTAGIGLGITAHLLQHNASKIILVSQKEEHAAEAQEFLEKYGDINKLEWIQCDFKDLKRTVEVAQVLMKEKQIHALICNAGEGVGKYNESVDGLDSHFQVNILSQIYLTLALFPILSSTPNSRIIQQSSELHRNCPSDTAFASVSEINTDIGPMKLYGRTKLAQILFVRALARRIKSHAPGFEAPSNTATQTQQGPWVIATHPGGVKTDQQDQAVDAYGTKGKVGVAAVRPFLKDPIDEGCRSALFAATAEDVVSERLQGVYIVPDRKVTEPNKQARDEALGENLWKLCRGILKEKVGVDVPQ